MKKDPFELEFDSDRVFHLLAYVMTAIMGVMGFIGGVTISLLFGFIGLVLFSGITYGAARLIGFLVKKIFQSSN